MVGRETEVEKDYVRTMKTVLYNKIKNWKGTEDARMNEYCLKATCTH